MKIAITGANGYIGQSLCSFLREKNDVYPVPSRSSGFSVANFTQLHDWFRVNGPFDVVIHCAISGGNRLIADTFDDYVNNIHMFDNLEKLHAEGMFNKLINIGSGAEIHSFDTWYGKSKAVVTNRAHELSNFYTIRVYAVFDENELERRFIKSAFTSLRNSKPIEIHQNKQMDFFYMQDFIAIVEKYISCMCTQKIYECCYDSIFTLEDISKLAIEIHGTGEYVTQKTDIGKPYVALNRSNEFITNLIGLKSGMMEMYAKL